MQLPPALTPWRELLELFPPEVAEALGPLVQRLDLAIGPLGADARVGEGDPDGIDGIARRGSYERLLITEWLLAEEVPEEFIRRALTSEHSFLKLARMTPRSSRVSVALFDGGPDQWGAPRIAQLATLIVLARRASAAGVQLGWGVMQDQDHWLCREVTPGSMRALLSARKLREASPADVEGRLAACPELAGSSDLWLVGSPPVPVSRSNASTIRIDDPVEADARRLDVTVTTPGRAPRTVALPLPDDSTCVRLLRDPFGSAVPSPERVHEENAPQSNLVFSMTGHKLFARAANGGIVAYPIPNSPRATVGNLRRHWFSTPGTLVAAGRFRKSTVVLLAGPDPSSLTVQFAGGPPRGSRDGTVEVAGADFTSGELTRLTPIVPAWLDKCAEFFVLVNGTLVQIGNVSRFGVPLFATMMGTGTVALASVRNGVAWVHRRDEGWCVSAEHQGEETSQRLTDGGGTRAFFGYGGAEADSQYGLLAWEVYDGMWHVQGASGVRCMSPPRGNEVVGVICAPGREQDPALVVMREDRKQLTLLSRGWSQPLPPARSEIREATVSPMMPLIAYCTVDGELVVYSLKEEAVVYRLTAGEPQ